MPTESYRARTEQNVIDSDGTVIISHGVLTGRISVYGEDGEKEHSRPWLHLDMEKLTIDEAAQRLRESIASNGINVLNVAGPRQSGDPAIHGVTTTVLEMAVG